MHVAPSLIVAVAVGAFVLSWVLVRLIRTVALRRGVLDIPNVRSSHVRPTPRLGGVGILAAVVVPLGSERKRGSRSHSVWWWAVGGRRVGEGEGGMG